MAIDKRRARMDQLFQRAGIPLSKLQSDLFWQFFVLFEKYNDSHDLSRIKRFDDIIIKHFIDSAIVASLVDLPLILLDVGTGAGFPGIPLKIMRHDLKLTLAEPKDKRVEFMEMVINELHFSGMSIYPKRVGDHSDFDVGGVITRAFEAVDGTLTRVKHFLPEGGKVIFMKGPAVEEDLGDITDDNRRDYKIIRDHEYELPLSGHTRRLVIFEKKSVRREHVYTATDSRYANAMVSSSENKGFREIKKILDVKGLKKSGRALVSGKKVISELSLLQPLRCEQYIVFDEYREDDEQMHQILGRANIDRKLVVMKRSLYNDLDSSGTGGPLLVYEYPEPELWSGIFSGIALLVPFQDPSNVGAVIRAAAAFGVKQIVLLGGAAHPFHPKSIRASAGTVFSVSLYEGVLVAEIGSFCAEKNIPVVALDARGSDIRTTKLPLTFALLPGVEGPGLPAGDFAVTISIPIDSAVESLNASTAAAVALFYLTRINRS